MDSLDHESQTAHSDKEITSKVSLKWIDSALMVGTGSNGVPLVMGEDRADGLKWRGASPMDLVLLAAASCATWDLVEILEKQRQPVEAIDVECEGEWSSDSRERIVGLHLIFNVQGPVSPERVERAIDLTLEKYCPVVRTLDRGVNVTSDLNVRAVNPT